MIGGLILLVQILNELIIPVWIRHGGVLKESLSTKGAVGPLVCVDFLQGIKDFDLELFLNQLCVKLLFTHLSFSLYDLIYESLVR